MGKEFVLWTECTDDDERKKLMQKNGQWEIHIFFLFEIHHARARVGVRVVHVRLMEIPVAAPQLQLGIGTYLVVPPSRRLFSVVSLFLLFSLFGQIQGRREMYLIILIFLARIFLNNFLKYSRMIYRSGHENEIQFPININILSNR